MPSLFSCILSSIISLKLNDLSWFIGIIGGAKFMGGGGGII